MEPDKKALRMAQEYVRHRVDLGFSCPRCDCPVYKTLVQNDAVKGGVVYVVSCVCLMVQYTMDTTPTANQWFKIALIADGYGDKKKNPSTKDPR